MVILTLPLLAFIQQPAPAAPAASPEELYYHSITIPVPAETVLEVGGLDTLPDGTVALCTRRGDVFFVKNAYDDPPAKATFSKFASGLHEPLGLLVDSGSILCVQRGELTRLKDTNNDGRADVFETVCDKWSISGNYHEYAYGPKRDRNGDLWVTLNLSWTDAGRSLVPWRGWAVKINKKGEMIPMCAGLRSPAGIGMNAEGDMFYTDNQGDWNGVCTLRHMERGDFFGHPESLKWWKEDTFNPPIAKPPQPPSGKLMHEVAKEIPELRLKLPAVWFPYPRMGQSASDIVCDETGGKFGPFAKQLFVGDQTTSEIFRIYLEKVNGKYQGACFPFRKEFDSGIVRLCWGKDGSMFVGETNRGWGSRGSRSEGLQRLVWTGKTPFEACEIHAKPDGFELVFTEAVDAAKAGDIKSYAASSFTYFYHERYGSEEIEKETLTITAATVAADGKSVRIAIDGLREGFVHEVAFEPASVPWSARPYSIRWVTTLLNYLPK